MHGGTFKTDDCSRNISQKKHHEWPLDKGPTFSITLSTPFPGSWNNLGRLHWAPLACSLVLHWEEKETMIPRKSQRLLTKRLWYDYITGSTKVIDFLKLKSWMMKFSRLPWYLPLFLHYAGEVGCHGLNERWEKAKFKAYAGFTTILPAYVEHFYHVYMVDSQPHSPCNR